MSAKLQRGQKIALATESGKATAVTAEFFWHFSETQNKPEIDTAAFLSDKTGKASGDADIVFYGNRRHTSGCVLHKGESATLNGMQAQIGVDLTKVPPAVERISFTATIYEATKRRQNFRLVKNFFVRLTDDATGFEILRFDVDDLSLQNAIVVGDIYRYKGEWKFAAVGSGFTGGLGALCRNFGIEVTDDDNEPSPPKKSPGSPTPNVVVPSPEEIELTRGEKIDIAKIIDGRNAEISVNLKWNATRSMSGAKKTGGFFADFFADDTARQNTGIDLDLGCLIEMADGSVGCIQALGGNLGLLNDYPYVELDHDDRTGDSVSGETLRVNGLHADAIARILVYAFIYEGAVNWQDANAIVTIRAPKSPDIIVKLDEYGSNCSLCALVMLTGKKTGGLSAEKIVRFFNGHADMDRCFGFGLKWVEGRKA